MVGLRGVGKTVLLREIRKRAEAKGFITQHAEAQEGQRIAALLVPVLRRVLLQLDRPERVVSAAKRGLRVLRSFIGNVTVAYQGVEVTLGVDPEPGVADSGNVEDDLKDLLEAVGVAAKETGKPIAIFVDELQYLSREDLQALIRGLHMISQESLPVVFFGAGLPQIIGNAGDAKSYAERLFTFPPIDRLPQFASYEAIRDPVNNEGSTVSEEALDEIYKQTLGYPYFLQVWGYEAWNCSPEEGIGLVSTKVATEKSIAKLDKEFFHVRYDRVTQAERNYMRALAELGDGVRQSAEVARLLVRTTAQVSQVRDSLIRKGMIYAPEHGSVAFTVPMFDAFMRRQMPMPGVTDEL
jgi:hypothetical protein